MLLIQELGNRGGLANARVDEVSFDRSHREEKDFNVSISSPRSGSTVQQLRKVNRGNSLMQKK